MKTLVRFLTRFLLRHWFPLLLLGIATYVVFQKELRIVLYFQKPEGDKTIALQKPEAEKQADPLEKTTESRFDFFSWRKENTPSPTVDWTAALRQIPYEKQLAYLKRFARVAVAERKKFGLPSSVILAMALLHSTAGEASIAQHANNHFGLQCSNFWNGKQWKSNNQCYRAYENAWSSFRDFSLFARKLMNEQSLPTPTDHLSWSKQLEKAGFSPIPQLSRELERIIKKFQLYELDQK